jgi:hypothetical protein
MEINYYKKKETNNLINWIDISDTTFNPIDHNLQNFPFKKKLYAKKDNILYEGMDTFILIWQTLHIFSFLTYISKFRIIRTIMNTGYYFFTVIRPYLPKRNRCADDYCEL